MLMFLPNRWWAIAESGTIRNKPVGLRRLGEDMVLWRNQQGKIICQSSQCPHRGANLAYGRVIDGCIECPYHGFRYMSDGHCTLIPCQGKKAHISPQMRVKTYVVQEAHDLVWVWWGEKQLDYPPIPWFNSLHDSPVRWASAIRDWNVHFTRTVEGALMDVYHGAFAHPRSAKLLGLGSSTLLDPIDTRVDGEIIHTWGQLRPETESFSPKGIINFKQWVYFPSLALYEFATESFSPKGILNFKQWVYFPSWALFNLIFDGTKLVMIATPIDEEKSWTYSRLYLGYGNPWISRLISKLLLWLAVIFVQPGDYKIVRSSQPKQSSLRVNKFLKTDKCFVAWHKLYENNTTTFAAHQPTQQGATRKSGSSEVE
jgi:phenylpropionate dioxygenase-like ring-hydroxylating dioxygenase large terminal subunit